MTVSEIIEPLGLRIAAGSDALCKEVSGCYIGDLLSWVMSHAQCGDAWITVMGNINAIAVASLTECACIILADSATLDDDAREKADSIGVAVLSSDRPAYDIAVGLSRLIKA